MADYVKPNDEGKAAQFELMSTNLPNHLGTLGIPANDPMVVQQAADAIYFRALLSVQGTFQGFGQAWTGWKNYERDGGPVAVPTPALPTLPGNFPAAVPPVITARYRALVKIVRARPTVTPAILEATKFVTHEIVNVWTGTKLGGNDPVGTYTRVSGLDPVAALTV